MVHARSVCEAYGFDAHIPGGSSEACWSGRDRHSRRSVLRKAVRCGTGAHSGSISAQRRRAGISRYMLKISPSFKPRLSTTYKNVWECTASSKACRNRYWRHSALVTCLKMASTRLFPTSDSAVEKNPRFRLMTRRSSSVNRSDRQTSTS